jgi:spore germination protein YaaH
MPAIGEILANPDARQRMRTELGTFLASDKFKGLTLDFEEVPAKAQSGYRSLINELSGDLHARGMKLYVCVPTRNVDFDFRFIAENSDGVILMNYDEHFAGGEPG